MRITHCFKKSCRSKPKDTLQLPLLQPEDEENIKSEEKVDSPPEYARDVINEKKKVHEGREDKDIIYIKDLVKMYLIY